MRVLVWVSQNAESPVVHLGLLLARLEQQLLQESLGHEDDPVDPQELFEVFLYKLV